MEGDLWHLVFVNIFDQIFLKIIWDYCFLKYMYLHIILSFFSILLYAPPPSLSTPLFRIKWYMYILQCILIYISNKKKKNSLEGQGVLAQQTYVRNWWWYIDKWKWAFYTSISHFLKIYACNWHWQQRKHLISKYSINILIVYYSTVQFDKLLQLLSITTIARRSNNKKKENRKRPFNMN